MKENQENHFRFAAGAGLDLTSKGVQARLSLKK
jgi:hypothetical protein